MSKIKNIEALRFIFTIMIVVFHIFMHPDALFTRYPEIYDKFFISTTNTYILVDFFFIVSGFFLYLTAEKYKTFQEFTIKRLVRLWPVPAFALFVFFIYSSCLNTEFLRYVHFLNLFMLRNTGLQLISDVNSTAWYISNLFWVSLLYFYLIKNFEKKNVNLTFALIIYFSYLILINNLDGFIRPRYVMFYNILNAGMLRALAGMAIGYFIGLVYKDNHAKLTTHLQHKFDWKNFKNIKYVFYSALEGGLLFYIINNLAFHKIKFQNDIFFIILLTGLFIVFIMRKGFVSNLFENNISAFLGKFAFSIYIMQETVFFILKRTLWQNSVFIAAHPVINVCISTLFCVIVGIITYYCVEKPCTNLYTRFNSNKKLDKIPSFETLNMGGGGPILLY